MKIIKCNHGLPIIHLIVKRSHRRRPKDVRFPIENTGVPTTIKEGAAVLVACTYFFPEDLHVFRVEHQI